MSVPSANTTVTTDRPYFDTERISVLRGTPASARSTGTVTYCSTSTGESAGAAVITCTCTLVMSGTASMGSRTAEVTPSAINSRQATSTTGRLASDQRTTEESQLISFLLGERAAQHAALQREDAVDHHGFALAQTREHADSAQAGLAEVDLVQLEVAVGLPDEHDGPAADLGDRTASDDQHGFTLLAAARHVRRTEEPQPQRAVRVVQANPRGDGARDGVDLAPHVFDGARKMTLRKGIQRDLGGRPYAHPLQILLEHASQEPDLGQIGDVRYDVLGAHGLSDHGAARDDDTADRRAQRQLRAAVRCAAEQTQLFRRRSLLRLQRFCLRSSVARFLACGE